MRIVSRNTGFERQKDYTLSQSDLSVPEIIAPSPESDNAGPVVASWQEQDPVLREMWLANKTPQEISDALGRSTAAIMTRAARLGLPRRAAPGRKPGVRTRGTFSDINATRSASARTAVSDALASVAPKTSLRVCLMCLTRFESQGPHNRICTGCRNSSEYDSACSLPEIHFSVSS